MLNECLKEEIPSKFHNWKDLARHFEIKEPEITSIEEEYEFPSAVLFRRGQEQTGKLSG